MYQYNTHTYWDVCYFTHKDTIFNDVYFWGDYHEVFEGGTSEQILTTFQKHIIKINDNNVG